MTSTEYRVAILMALSAFFTLAGYEFLRSASTVLFKSAYGAESLPLVMALMPFVVLGGVALYGQILTRIGPRRTLLVTTLASAVAIVGCFVAIGMGSDLATAVLYLVKEFYIVLLIEQYWSYINSSLSEPAARRLNGPITGVAGLGGAFGGVMLSMLAPVMGTDWMILIAAATLLPAAALSDFTYRHCGEPAAPEHDQPVSSIGLELFRDSSTLRYLLAIVLASQVVSAVLDLKFQELLSVEFAGRIDEETAFQGRFFGTLSSVVLVLQFVIIPVVMSRVSLRLIHLLMPTIHLTAIGVALVDPGVWSVGVAFFLFKAFDYSVFRAAKELLYIPLSFDARYRAKEVIDVFGYRTGKGLTSVVIVLMQRLGVVVSGYYLVSGLVAAAVWFSLVFPLTRKPEPPHAQSEDPIARQTL